MSGGSHNYICYRIKEELCGQMEDAELNDLMQDVADLAHDLEWYHSSDICEETYRKSVTKFKQKWFDSNRNKRLAKYIKDSNELHTRTILRLLEEGDKSCT